MFNKEGWREVPGQRGKATKNVDAETSAATGVIAGTFGAENVEIGNVTDSANQQMEPRPDFAPEGAENERVAEIMPESMSQVFDNETMREIDSWDAAYAAVLKEFGETVSATAELGTGFGVLNDKGRLVGLPCLFLEWTFYKSNVGNVGEFVSVKTVARAEGGVTLKVIINDGSTGIYKQLREYTDKTGRVGGMIARGGLRRSDYTFSDNGAEKAATTFYIDTSVA